LAKEKATRRLAPLGSRSPRLAALRLASAQGPGSGRFSFLTQ